MRWTVGDVVLLTLSLPGSNNNRGTDTTAAPVEFTERNAANLAWLRDGFAVAAEWPSLGLTFCDSQLNNSQLPTQNSFRVPILDPSMSGDGARNEGLTRWRYISRCLVSD